MLTCRHAICRNVREKGYTYCRVDGARSSQISWIKGRVRMPHSVQVNVFAG